jgi:O-glycosyl hydrolase
MDSGVSNRVVLVAINKSQTAALNAGLRLTHNVAFSKAEVYRITGANGGAGGCSGPVRQPDVTIASTNAFNASLPAQSVTVFVLKP